MKTETTQPLTEQPPRSTADSELVGKVLGGQAAGEMKELTGDQPTREDESGSNKLEMDEGERAATTKAEQTVSLEERKAEYHEWLEEMYGSRIATTAVKSKFKFLPNGDVESIGGVFFAGVTVKKFPSSLKKINGLLNLSETQWDIPLDFLKDIEIKNTMTIDMTLVDRIPPEVKCRDIIVRYSSKVFTIRETERAVQTLKDKGYKHVFTEKQD